MDQYGGGSSGPPPSKLSGSGAGGGGSGLDGIFSNLGINAKSSPVTMSASGGGPSGAGAGGGGAAGGAGNPTPMTKLFFGPASDAPSAGANTSASDKASMFSRWGLG